ARAFPALGPRFYHGQSRPRAATTRSGRSRSALFVSVGQTIFPGFMISADRAHARSAANCPTACLKPSKCWRSAASAGGFDGGCAVSARWNEPGNDPVALPEATAAREALTLEHGERPVMQERGGDRSAVHCFGVTLHRSPSKPTDLPEGPVKRSGGDTLAAV